jgi:hypothetical protein
MAQVRKKRAPIPPLINCQGVETAGKGPDREWLGEMSLGSPTSRRRSFYFCTPFRTCRSIKTALLACCGSTVRELKPLAEREGFLNVMDCEPLSSHHLIIAKARFVNESKTNIPEGLYSINCHVHGILPKGYPCTNKIGETKPNPSSTTFRTQRRTAGQQTRELKLLVKLAASTMSQNVGGSAQAFKAC